MYQALYRTWRPRTFDEVVGQPHVTKALKSQVEAGRLAHAYLFIGTRGTGKTSCAKILAKAVNCHAPQSGNPCNSCPACLGIDSGSILDVVEMDAASNNGVDHVRALRDEAVYTPAAAAKRVYIIDEVHMLSTAAFNALLKILEEPPAHLLFILATTEAHKIPATILSRCQRFSFKRIPAGEIAGRLRLVAEREGLTLTEEAALLLARLADGSARDALALLDQCTYADPIDSDVVLAVAGLAGGLNTARLMTAVAKRRSGEALSLLNALYSDGKDVAAMLGELGTLIRDVLLLKIAPENAAALQSGGWDGETLRAVLENTTPERLLYCLNTINAARSEMGRSADRKLTAELCLLRLCDETLADGADALLARISRLETGMAASAESRMPPLSAPPAEPTVPAGAAPDEKPEPARAEAERPSGTAAQSIYPAILGALQDKISVSDYTILDDPARIRGEIVGSSLILTVEDPFTKHIAERADILAEIKAAASAIAGSTLAVKVREGEKPATAGADKLDALGRFGVTTFK